MKYVSFKLSNTKLFGAAASLACLSLVSACGSDSADDVKKSVSNLTGESELQGKWTTTCGKAGVLDASGKSTYIFEPLRYEKALNIYKDDQCNETLAVATYKGEFKIGTGEGLAEGVKRIDVTPKTLILKANSKAGVAAMNLISVCGINDWAVNVERDVSVAAKGGKCLSETIDTPQYDVYTLGNDQLKFGATLVLGAPTSEDQRPTKVNETALVPAK